MTGRNATSAQALDARRAAKNESLETPLYKCLLLNQIIRLRPAERPTLTLGKQTKRDANISDWCYSKILHFYIINVHSFLQWSKSWINFNKVRARTTEVTECTMNGNVLNKIKSNRAKAISMLTKFEIEEQFDWLKKKDVEFGLIERYSHRGIHRFKR